MTFEEVVNFDINKLNTEVEILDQLVKMDEFEQILEQRKRVLNNKLLRTNQNK